MILYYKREGLTHQPYPHGTACWSTFRFARAHAYISDFADGIFWNPNVRRVKRITPPSNTAEGQYPWCVLEGIFQVFRRNSALFLWSFHCFAECDWESFWRTWDDIRFWMQYNFIRRQVQRLPKHMFAILNIIQSGWFRSVGLKESCCEKKRGRMLTGPGRFKIQRPLHRQVYSNRENTPQFSPCICRGDQEIHFVNLRSTGESDYSMWWNILPGIHGYTSNKSGQRARLLKWCRASDIYPEFMIIRFGTHMPLACAAPVSRESIISELLGHKNTRVTQEYLTWQMKISRYPSKADACSLIIGIRKNALGRQPS